MSSKPAVPEPTEIAGRYQVERKLGQGAFGTVFKAKDKVLGRMVAIKTIRMEALMAQGASAEEMLERFRREATVSAQLKHPNIVTIHDFGSADGMSYVAMEYIDGMGLDKLISEAGRLGVERAAGLAIQVADALDFAHRHNVVHRDIKPANIMVEAGDRVKVTDFGIAKVRDSTEHLTMTGSLLGTPSYMSPEQAKGGAIDGRSDLFSVGCVLYEMLAGKKAFRGESITALIFKIITEEPLPIRELAADTPDAMVRIIERALSKPADARYQTGRELADDLLRLTRAGHMPTLRQSETPTVPGAPTVLVPVPTLQVPPTQVSPPTRAAAPATAPRPVERPRPPTPPLPTPAPLPRDAVAAVPAPARRKSGGGAGLLMAIALVGLGFAGIVAAAGWYFLLRKPATPEAPVATTVADAGAPRSTLPAPPSQAPPEASAAPPPASAPAASSTAPPPSAAAPEPSRSAPMPPDQPAAARPAKPPRSKPAGPAPPEAETAASGTANGAAVAFLDEEPAPVDGAEAGQRLADTYRSHAGTSSGSTFGTSGRFARRERSPRNAMPLERPAIATLRHLINAEEAFNKKQGRYGSLADMANAQTLFLDVAAQGGSFQRRNYRFELTVERDNFKVVAMPMAPGLRPFIGDESGYIRQGLE